MTDDVREMIRRMREEYPDEVIIKAVGQIRNGMRTRKGGGRPRKRAEAVIEAEHQAPLKALPKSDIRPAGPVEPPVEPDDCMDEPWETPGDPPPVKTKPPSARESRRAGPVTKVRGTDEGSRRYEYI